MDNVQIKSMKYIVFNFNRIKFLFFSNIYPKSYAKQNYHYTNLLVKADVLNHAKRILKKNLVKCFLTNFINILGQVYIEFSYTSSIMSGQTNL